jgi:hypothetical protein
MTFLQAAVEVLRGARSPLSTREVVQRAKKRGLIESKGKTPEATLSAALYRRIALPDSPIERVYVRGASRAKRETVAWRLK